MEPNPYQRKQEPLLIVISGPSGVGKDSVVQRLKERQVPFHFVVTAKQQVRNAFASGQDVVMRLDVQGAATIRQLAPESILVFLLADSEEDMVTRLRGRQTDTEDAIKMRIATARQELKRMAEFDYCVLNPQGKIDAAVDRILSIIDAEHAKVKQRKVEL